MRNDGKKGMRVSKEAGLWKEGGCKLKEKEAEIMFGWWQL